MSFSVPKAGPSRKRADLCGICQVLQPYRAGLVRAARAAGPAGAGPRQIPQRLRGRTAAGPSAADMRYLDHVGGKPEAQGAVDDTILVRVRISYKASNALTERAKRNRRAVCDEGGLLLEEVLHGSQQTPRAGPGSAR